jgi:hypothetical protein
MQFSGQLLSASAVEKKVKIMVFQLKKGKIVV